jgi:hypothetical protein
MISFKEAIKQWEEPFNETMIGYSALTRKASNAPDNVFVIAWKDKTDKINIKNFQVGLKKYNGRWLVDEKLFRNAIYEKIKTMEISNSLGKTSVKIKYPQWLNVKDLYL